MTPVGISRQTARPIDRIYRFNSLNAGFVGVDADHQLSFPVNTLLSG